MKVKIVKGNHARMENNKLVIHPEGEIIEVTEAENEAFPDKFAPVKPQRKKSEVTDGR